MPIKPFSSIIFVNQNISNSARDFLVSQLLIDTVIPDGYWDSGMIAGIRANGERVLVMRDFVERDQANWKDADAVLFVKNGVVSLEHCKVGPPGRTIAVVSVTNGFLGLY